MCIQLGQIAPDFTQLSSRGVIHFYEWLGQSWCVLFSHPRDLTDQCRAELAEAQLLRPEWDKRNVKVIALSIDNAQRPRSWDDELGEPPGQDVAFPMLSDTDRTVSDLYGWLPSMADPNASVRHVLVIDPARVVRIWHRYAVNAERAFVDILRDVDALQGGSADHSASFGDPAGIGVAVRDGH